MKKITQIAFALLFMAGAIGNVFAGGGSQQSSSGGAASNMPANDGPLAAYPKTLEITVPMSVGQNIYYAQGESIEKNFVTDFYTEKLNILWKPKWSVDSSQADEKITAAVASNDLPDMFTSGTDMLGRLIKAGQVQPIGDVYEKYATPRLKEISNYQDGRGFLAGSSGGKLYAMPVSTDFANNIAMIFIRKDWLDKLNLKTPNTMDELLAVARAFRDRDPDGNGRNDTIAIALDKGWGQDSVGINTFANPFNAYHAIWIPDGSGGLKYSSVQPEMKEALQLLQNLYKEGLLDREFAVKDGSKVAEDIAAGKVGIFPGVFWSSLWPLATTLDNNPGADWVPVMIPVNKDGKHVTQNKIASFFTVVVRAGFEHPEALIKSMNLWAEMFHGEYADYFNGLLSTPKYMGTADNWHSNAKPVFFSHPEKNIHLSANFIDAWNAQNIDLCITGEARNRYDIVKAGGSQGWAHKKFLMEAEPLLKKYDGYVYDEFVGAATGTMVLRQANLNKLEDETFFNIIMGSPIGSFDTFVRDWKAQGGDTITKEVSDWYKAARR